MNGARAGGSLIIVMSVSLVWLRRLPKEEIAARVAAFRAKLADTGANKDVPRDEFGRVA